MLDRPERNSPTIAAPRSRRCAASVSLLLALLGAGTIAEAGVILVPREQPTIAAALAVANDGDVIQLAHGIYADPFAFGLVGVTLRGDPREPAAVVVAPTAKRPNNPFVVDSAPSGGALGFEGITFGGFVEYNITSRSLTITDCRTAIDDLDRSVAFNVSAGVLSVDRFVVPDLGSQPTDAPLFTLTTGAATLKDLDIGTGKRPAMKFADAVSVLEGCSIVNLTLGTIPALHIVGGEVAVLDSNFASINEVSGIFSSDASITVVGTSFNGVGTSKGSNSKGLFIAGPSATIIDCTFTGCGGFNANGAGASIKSPTILVKNTTFIDNNPVGAGAGALFLQGVGTIQNVDFIGNHSDFRGGAMRSVGAFTIDACLFEANSAGDGDGAVSIQGSCAFYGCTFKDNHAGDGVGGMDILGGAVTVRIGLGVFVECEFQGNVAGADGKPIGYGGAVAVVDGKGAFDSCTISGNVAQDLGGGIYIDPSLGELLLENTTICSNVPDQLVGSYTDLGGNVICGCLGDLEGDGLIGPTDLAALLGAWGPCSCPADLNGDGEVGAADLAILLGAWGGCKS